MKQTSGHKLTSERKHELKEHAWGGKLRHFIATILPTMGIANRETPKGNPIKCSASAFHLHTLQPLSNNPHK